MITTDTTQVPCSSQNNQACGHFSALLLIKHMNAGPAFPIRLGLKHTPSACSTQSAITLNYRDVLRLLLKGDVGNFICFFLHVKN